MKSPEADLGSSCNCGTDKSFVLSVLAMMTALQTTIIFLVVLVVVCKYNKRKATPKHPEITRDDQPYEIMNPVCLTKNRPLHKN